MIKKTSSIRNLRELGRGIPNYEKLKMDPREKGDELNLETDGFSGTRSYIKLRCADRL